LKWKFLAARFARNSGMQWPNHHLSDTDRTRIYYSRKENQGAKRTVIFLKVPTRENFSLAFIALSEPICVCDLGTGKNQLFYQLTPDFDDFWFFEAY
jgi:hypothetical protein